MRAWRRDRAKEQGVPPYVIFQDKTLVEIAIQCPRDEHELGRINGVGSGKLDRYGKAVLEALKARGEKVAVNESSSGGLISAALLSVPGATR